MSRGGDSFLLHQLLGPGFACFQLCTIGTWSEHRHSGLSQPIGNPCGQGGFRTDHHQVDRGAAAMRDQSLGIQLADAEGTTALEIDGAAVARGDPDLLHFPTTTQRPGQSLLSTAAADHQQVAQGGQ